MFEDAAVCLFLDILEVFRRRPVCRISLAHVTQAPGELRQPLAIAAVADPLDAKVVGLLERGSREDGDARLAVEHVGR